MKKKSVLLLPVFFLSIISCASGNCRENTLPNANKKVDLSMPSTAVEKIKVFKYDGSLQCGMNKAISVSEMQKELKSIRIYSSENKADGLMHIQMCGSATGTANVYQIDRKDLSEAKKIGFKEWLWD